MKNAMQLKEVKYRFNLLFEDRTINILAYNPETPEFAIIINFP